MTGIEVGIASVVLIVLLIYAGLYITISLGLVSFLGVWIIKGNLTVPAYLLSQAIANTISEQVFATVPLFALMGLMVSKSGLGKDVYQVANFFFYKIRGGLGVATVAANAVFAAITGSSIASASVFTRISVPEMRRFKYRARFAVGVVAGSSVLGMLIPPSAMLIIYAIVAEQSVGQMFLAGSSRDPHARNPGQCLERMHGSDELDLVAVDGGKTSDFPKSLRQACIATDNDLLDRVRRTRSFLCCKQTRMRQRSPDS